MALLLCLHQRRTRKILDLAQQAAQNVSLPKSNRLSPPDNLYLFRFPYFGWYNFTEPFIRALETKVPEREKVFAQLSNELDNTKPTAGLKHSGLNRDQQQSPTDICATICANL